MATRSLDIQQYKEQNLFIMDHAVNPRGRILGCMGMGAIARRTATKAAAFGLKIHYYDVVRAPREFEESIGATYHSDYKSLLAIEPDCINVSGASCQHEKKLLITNHVQSSIYEEHAPFNR